MAGRMDKPRPFCLFLLTLALRGAFQICGAVLDPKKRMLHQKSIEFHRNDRAPKASRKCEPRITSR
jgi:hypothetical protein